MGGDGLIRILHTGDIHLGRAYHRQSQTDPTAAARCHNARLEALQNVIILASQKHCDFLVIAGDLFDNKSVSVQLQKQTASILADCACPVLILPGNHDYYEGANDALWSKFMQFAGDNTVLCTEQHPLEMGNVIFYPCACTDRYSSGNALGWVKAWSACQSTSIHVGLAHGALEGLSCDTEKRYYSMTRCELESCPMDVWLLGHTHIPSPNQDVITGQRIFNAGTPQQTDIANNTDGSVFLIEVDDAKNITARKYTTGIIHFDMLHLTLQHGQSLQTLIETAVNPYDKPDTLLRLEITGIASTEDFQMRETIYNVFRQQFLSFVVIDSALQQEITSAMIETETIDGSVENRLLKQYIGQPDLLNLAYALVKECKGEV